MKIALISPYESIASYGVRMISSILKQQGYQTGIFFIPLPFEVKYTDSLLTGLMRRLAGYEVIGISLTSNYFDRAVQLTQFLKNNGSWKIVWGGIHPTVEPDECLDYADFVVRGESELSFSALLQCIKTGGNIESVKGISYCEKTADGKIIKKNNPVMSLVENLNSLPFPDYSFDEHYIWSGVPEGIGVQGDKGIGISFSKDKVQSLDDNLWLPLTHKHIAANTGGDYLTLSSRGCPHSCTYCCNNFLKKYYKDEKWFRKRSIENLFQELTYIKNNHPYFKRIYYDDDAFMMRPVEEIKLFAERMKKEIGLPFVITGITPASLSEEKLKILIVAGLQWIRLGVQSISDRVLRDVYNRPANSKVIKNAVEVIRKFHKQMDRVWYDFIIENPWEATEENLETLRFILELPRPFAMCIYSLTFFPGTEISEKAFKEGIIKDKQAQVYRKSYKTYADSYVNNLFLLFTISRLPLWVLRLFVNRWIIALGLHHPLWKCYIFLRDWKTKRNTKKSKKN